MPPRAERSAQTPAGPAPPPGPGGRGCLVPQKTGGGSRNFPNCCGESKGTARGGEYLGLDLFGEISSKCPHFGRTTDPSLAIQASQGEAIQGRFGLRSDPSSLSGNLPTTWPRPHSCWASRPEVRIWEGVETDPAASEFHPCLLVARTNRCPVGS